MSFRGGLPRKNVAEVEVSAHSLVRCGCFKSIEATTAHQSMSSLARDLEDPDFLREFGAESMRIATIDEVVTAVDDISGETGDRDSVSLARSVRSED